MRSRAGAQRNPLYAQAYPLSGKRAYCPHALAQFSVKEFPEAVPLRHSADYESWNYPFLLTLDPLVDALAAGNTVVLKPSAYSPATTSRIISRIIAECFDESYVSVVTGGRAENACLLREHFDYIFFLREPVRRQGSHETRRRTPHPVTPGAGRQKPCIVEKSADLAPGSQAHQYSAST